ncbi:MAG: ABC transporter ATP-binding protein [Bdellovibrionales bacterium RIFOXYD1_FULL_53_11]|nr:MAG: ABC transporter ATP-binding protein [Bdellovibrionales bacterium RIFOXYD1_FULL_53_11]
METALEIRELHKKFGDKIVHQGVSFKLLKGEILGLFGGSGSGKSVILRSIIGLEKPDAGEIIFEGRDISILGERDMIAVRTKIAYVFQNGALFDSLTVEENLAYPLEEHTSLSDSEILEKINDMLDLIDMPGSNKLLPAELSGGMQKRAGLARAIILEPQVILFDEPTAGLDPVNTKRLVDNVKKLKKKGNTGIFVTHDIPSAFDICDRIAILFEGRIYVIDTVENIKNSSDDFVQAFITGALEHAN